VTRGLTVAGASLTMAGDPAKAGRHITCHVSCPREHLNRNRRGRPSHVGIRAVRQWRHASADAISTEVAVAAITRAW